METQRPLLAVLCGIGVALACSTTESPQRNVSVQQLAAGDSNCPNGGVAVTVDSTTAYACNGAPGAAGVPGAPGAPGGGLYTVREDVYCDVSTTRGVGGLVEARCRKETDLPLSGNCTVDVGYSSPPPLVDVSQPIAWTGPTPGVSAGWQCGFHTNSGTPIGSGSPGGAWICCVATP